MIELLKGFPENVVAIACRGHVTREDYDTVLIPAVDKALQSNDTVRLLYEIGSDFDGYDAGAAWEDFKVGMEHFSRWERCRGHHGHRVDQAHDAALRLPRAWHGPGLSDGRRRPGAAVDHASFVSRPTSDRSRQFLVSEHGRAAPGHVSQQISWRRNTGKHQGPIAAPFPL